MTTDKTSQDSTNDKQAPELSTELIEKLMPAIADQVAKDLRSFLSEQISPLAERLADFESRYEQENTTAQDLTEEDSGESEASAMELRVKQLEQALADKEAAEKQSRFDSALRDAVETNGAKFPKEAAAFLKATIAQQVSETKGGKFLAKDGRDLSAVVKDFFSTDFGKHLLPSQASDGVGASQGESKTGQINNRDAEIIAALI